MRTKRGLALLFSSFALTSVSGLLGGGPLLVLRKHIGRWKYLALALATISLGFIGLPMQIVLPFATCFSVVFFFEEARQLHGSNTKSGLISILSTIGLGCLSLGAWISFNNIDFISVVRSEVEKSLSQLLSINPDMDVSVEAVIQQVPSIIIVLLMLVVWFMLLGEKYIELKSTESRQVNSKMEPVEDLSGFRVPEWMIWPSLVALLFSFIEVDQPMLSTVAVNALNVFIVLYFFQGIAVVASYFSVNRIGLFWRCFWYILLIVQMFPVLSAIGVADFWFEFRNKMFSKAKENLN